MQLYSPNDLAKLQDELPSLVETVDWVKNFLGKPHPDLGRSGPVCPFVPCALKQNTIRLAVIHSKNLEQSQIEELVRSCRDSFLEIEPKQGNAALNKALLLVFPEVSAEEAFTIIDGVQQKLKPYFVEEGLMLGEFHQGNESPGLHNPNFRPLRSPIPMLAIRFMAETDLPFLSRLIDQPQVRVQYLEAYLQRLGKTIKDEQKLQQARLALAQAQQEVEGSEPILNPSKCPFARLVKFLQRCLRLKDRLLSSPAL